MPAITKLAGHHVEQVYENGVTCRISFECDRTLRWEAVAGPDAGQVEADKLAFNRTNLGDYAFYDPDHTVRIPERWAAPRRLLAEIMHTPPIELYWRQERAQPCGASGGLPFTHPALAATLARTRLAEAEAQGVKTLISDDPQVLYHLQHHTDNVTVRGLLELLAEQVNTE